MRRVRLVIVQFVTTLSIVGIVLPAVLFAFPAGHSAKIGLALAGTLIVAVFFVLRMVWPAAWRE